MHCIFVKSLPITDSFKQVHPYVIVEPTVRKGSEEIMYCSTLECAARTLEAAGPLNGRPDITSAAYVRDMRDGTVYMRQNVIGTLRRRTFTFTPFNPYGKAL